MMHCAYDTDEKKGLDARDEAVAEPRAARDRSDRSSRRPADFEASAAMVDEEDVAESTPCGPDPEPYLELIGKYADAGFTHVYMHQIGDNQDEFAEFAAKELMPKL